MTYFLIYRTSALALNWLFNSLVWKCFTHSVIHSEDHPVLSKAQSLDAAYEYVRVQNRTISPGNKILHILVFILLGIAIVGGCLGNLAFFPGQKQLFLGTNTLHFGRCVSAFHHLYSSIRLLKISTILLDSKDCKNWEDSYLTNGKKQCPLSSLRIVFFPTL